jgi:hypothetical protein
MCNAQGALALYAESQAPEDGELPASRVPALSEPAAAADLRECTLALIALPTADPHAAE